ncbi:MAG TPA: CHASE4 domain-containing protein, partial [Pseudolabrys sp.]|nr:CHASE4 domain-containing protein [Pseudolabrys sp.]
MRILVLLIGLIITTGLAVLVVVVSYFVRAEDRQATQASRIFAQSALEVERRDIASILDSYAWWDDAVAQVQQPVDPKIIDDNFGSYQTRSHGITASFVLSPADRTTFGFIDGKPAAADALKTLSGGLGTLVRQARESSLVEPVAAAGFLMLKDTPMMVGVEAITPQLGSPGWPPVTPRYVLVFARPMDESFLARVAGRAGLVGLRIVNRTSPSFVGLPLTSPDGIEIGWLEWVPQSPASNLVISAAPPGGITLLFMAIIFGALLHRIRQVGDVLRRQAALIDEVRDTIFSTDVSGAITHWSRGAALMLGYEGREIIGKPFSVLLPEADRASAMKRLEGLRRNRRHFELEIPLRKQDGRIFPAHLSLSQLRDRAGRFAGMVGYGLDITVQKNLERRLEELATVDELTGACNRRYLQIH